MYLSTNTQTISDFSDANINALYSEGYVFTRVGRGVMKQTRSLRIDLSKFETSSENRRILKKNQNIIYHLSSIPFANYHWSIGKLAHDFYETKFGKGTFSANKIKELLTDPNKSNFNQLFVYSIDDEPIGYCIARETNELIHYSYPFYELGIMNNELGNIGIGMMTRAILHAKEHGKKYIYLGSAQRPSDTYKLQFSGLEWFTGTTWSTDEQQIKKVLHDS